MAPWACAVVGHRACRHPTEAGVATHRFRHARSPDRQDEDARGVLPLDPCATAARAWTKFDARNEPHRFEATYAAKCPPPPGRTCRRGLARCPPGVSSRCGGSDPPARVVGRVSMGAGARVRSRAAVRTGRSLRRAFLSSCCVRQGCAAHMMRKVCLHPTGDSAALDLRPRSIALCVEMHTPVIRGNTRHCSNVLP